MLTFRRSRVARLWLLALLVVVAAPTDGAAQYFGRNKVQYRTFDFRVLKTPHFDIYFYPEEEVAARDAAGMAERWYARLSTMLDYEFEERQPLILYANQAEFQQTNILGSIGEGTGGVTESAKQRIIMPLTGAYDETDQVLGHELVHAFQYDISGLGRSRGAVSAGARTFVTAPLWFTEGMAEYLTVGPISTLTAMWLRDAALRGEVPSIERLTNDPRIFPYRYGHAVWAYIAGRWGDAVIGQILKLVGQGVPYEEAFERLLNQSLDDISEQWEASVRRAYLPMLADRPEPSEFARPLITERRGGGQLNVSPVLSPDGRYLAFLSERDLDVDLWLADATTGKVIRRLQKGTAFDPHFASLNFISSAGTFSPDSRQFAFAAQRAGRDVLVVLDVQRARRVREYAVPGLGDISNPNWSPDGQTIIVSATRGGISDLYAVDVRSGDVRQLTDDRYADLQPVYSPDGRTVAFVSDREVTDLQQLRYGDHRIFLLDVASGAIRQAPAMERQNINPAWGRDGSLYFISDRSGIANVYRVVPETGALTQVTQIFTGVSGITDLSPALTTARSVDRLVFTAYEDGGYNLYELSNPRDLAGTPVPTPSLVLVGADSIPLPAVLPPLPRPAEPPYTRVAQLLTDPNFGLPPVSAVAAYDVVNYSPRLSLDFLGQPQVGVRTGGVFGRGGVSGGIFGVFSDMLGRHTLYGAVQAQGQFDEIGFATIYLNQRNRWNWGVAAQRLPQVYGYYAYDQAGFPYAVRARYFDTGLRGIAQYPFSTVQRIEFSGGLRRFSRDFQFYNLATGERSDQDGRAFNLAEASAALVYDNSLSGYTSPFAGQRYRFELSPTFGTIQFVQGLADYRRYFFARPFTLALRAMHYGRYGRDAEDSTAFYPIFLGYSSLIRGYYDTFNACTGANDLEARAACALLNPLYGSRVGVFNAELRFPLIRQVVVGPGIGLPPIEGIAFADAGIAWNSGDELRFQRLQLQPNPAQPDLLEADPSRRALLTSGGVGARVNLLGLFILEIDYVNAFDWPGRGWHWQFSLQPGF